MATHDEEMLVKAGSALPVSGFMNPGAPSASGPRSRVQRQQLTETHCVHQHGVCDLSSKQQTQQNRFGSEA